MRYLHLIGLLALALVLTGAVRAQDNPYELDGSIAAGGALTVDGGPYTLSAQMARPGQSPAGGGDYQVGEGPPLAAPRSERLYLPIVIR